MYLEWRRLRLREASPSPSQSVECDDDWQAEDALSAGCKRPRSQLQALLKYCRTHNGKAHFVVRLDILRHRRSRELIERRKDRHRGGRAMSSFHRLRDRTRRCSAFAATRTGSPESAFFIVDRNWSYAFRLSSTLP